MIMTDKIGAKKETFRTTTSRACLVSLICTGKAKEVAKSARKKSLTVCIVETAKNSI